MRNDQRHVDAVCEQDGETLNTYVVVGKHYGAWFHLGKLTRRVVNPVFRTSRPHQAFRHRGATSTPTLW
jgi:hypothetical protein